jgi:hypothetical protein
MPVDPEAAEGSTPGQEPFHQPPTDRGRRFDQSQTRSSALQQRRTARAWAASANAAVSRVNGRSRRMARPPCCPGQEPTGRPPASQGRCQANPTPEGRPAGRHHSHAGRHPLRGVHRRDRLGRADRERAAPGLGLARPSRHDTYARGSCPISELEQDAMPSGASRRHCPASTVHRSQRRGLVRPLPQLSPGARGTKRLRPRRGIATR